MFLENRREYHTRGYGRLVVIRSIIDVSMPQEDMVGPLLLDL